MPARLAMEEGNRETRALNIKNVRRRLFKDDDDDGETSGPRGTDDNEANIFMEEARKNFQNAKEKWNFDFAKNEPLPGRWQYVKANEDFPPDEPETPPSEKEEATSNAPENAQPVDKTGNSS
ncbi:uncharacterized protein [Fopius arisanus]|uniref:Uncharacterized protein isoform X1 n=1 Tax=Fopius arisanus TaxID=64838 RepID=A0A9R1U168_9HYME|nr:PREDICTED: uncharacterized protein LOC105267261 isoform X1 [Fopius arisanus]